MTNITFKNGLPLFLQPAPGSDIGLVATDTGCCCPPPPPERCWAGGFCSYFIELVEPSELAVKTTAIDCLNQTSSEGKTIPTLLSAIFPVTGQEIWPTERNESTSNVSNFGSLYAVSECELIGNDDFVEGDPGLNYQLFSASRSVGVGIASGMDAESGQPVMRARISLSLGAGFANFGDLGSETVARTYYGEFDIPSTCVVSPERECFPDLYPSVEFLRIDTPLEITISGDGTSSLGSLDLISDNTFGDGTTGLAEDAIEVLAEATSYTFRITARENCLPPPDPCEVTIDGEPVDISTIDPEVALDVQWTHDGRTLQVPDGQQTFDFWDGFSTGPDVTWHELYQIILESRTFESWQLVAGDTPNLGGWTPPGACAKWAVTAIDETTCRIQGCVQTSYDEGTADTGIRPYESTDYQIRALWRWTCDIVSGVQGAVTYELIEGYRYEWDVATLSFLLVTGGDVGDEPVVTVTLAP